MNDFDFYDIPVTTQTFIVKILNSPACIDLQRTYNILDRPTAKYDVGSCKNFMNCIALRYNLTPTRQVALKIFANGTLQFTGCKSVDDVATILVNDIVDVLPKDIHHHHIFKIYSVMRNIDFDLGFNLDRIAFGNFFARQPNFKVSAMTSTFMAVKIKAFIDPNTRLSVYNMTVYTDDNRCAVLRPVAPEPISARRKEKNRHNFVSINVFSNGKVIMSATDEEIQEKVYREFITIVNLKYKEFISNYQTSNKFWTCMSKD